MDLPHSGIMRTKATKAYKANAATECLHSGMVEPKLRTPKASTCQVLSALPSVENDFITYVILEGVLRPTGSTELNVFFISERCVHVEKINKVATKC